MCRAGISRRRWSRNDTFAVRLHACDTFAVRLHACDTFAVRLHACDTFAVRLHACDTFAVRLHACDKSRTIEHIFMKFCISVRRYCRLYKSWLNSDKSIRSFKWRIHCVSACTGTRYCPKKRASTVTKKSNCWTVTIKYYRVDDVGYALYIPWTDKCYEEWL